jgi:Fur family iron response transcriptional regulator
MTHNGTRAAATIEARLTAAGIMPTAQRLQIATVLLERPQHLSAEEVLARARDRGPVSKATVYNTLQLFADRGLCRMLVVDPERVYFDSTVTPHHHLFDEDSHALIDIPAGDVRIEGLPALPDGKEAVAVDVVVRMRAKR